MGRLDGKVALVTGAALGQGAAISQRFAEEGAKVALADVLDEEGSLAAKELGDAARFVHHDVSDEDSWNVAVRATVDAFGRIDVLVNNAGILRWNALVDTTLDDYMAVIKVNQVGCFLGMRTVAPLMKEQGSGSIVNTSSTAGLEGMAGIIAYSASKFAVRGMTKTAAIELGKHGIRVNAVCPGGINTRMGNPLEQDEEDLQRANKRNPIPRIGRPDEIAAMMVFLASDESSYCTGAEFVVDGGYTAGKNPMGI